MVAGAHGLWRKISFHLSLLFQRILLLLTLAFAKGFDPWYLYKSLIELAEHAISLPDRTVGETAA